MVTYILIFVLHEVANDVHHQQIFEEDDQQRDGQHVEFKVPHYYEKHLEHNMLTH